MGKLAPGVVGSFVSLLFAHGPWPRKVAMFMAGAACARFGTSAASSWAGLDAGFTGFLLGLFGMAVIAKTFETWQAFELGSLLRDALRKLLGLPTKEG